MRDAKTTMLEGGFAGSDPTGIEVPKVNRFARRMREATRILCPFCGAEVPAPGRVMTVFTPDGCLAERCSCGAVYAVDETGRMGGQALLDAQAVLCEGDLHLAMALESGKQVDVLSRQCPVQTIRGGASRFNRTSPSARLWFVRRRLSAEPAGS